MDLKGYFIEPVDRSSPDLTNKKKKKEKEEEEEEEKLKKTG